MDVIDKMVQKSVEKGDFDNLKGLGKPINIEEDFLTPQDKKMEYKILKNAGFIPKEIQGLAKVKKEILKVIEDATMSEEEKRERLVELRVLESGFLIR